MIPFSSYVSIEKASLALTWPSVKTYCLENCPFECLSEYLNSTLSPLARDDLIELNLEKLNSRLAISFIIPNGSTFSKSLNRFTGFDENKLDVSILLVT